MKTGKNSYNFKITDRITLFTNNIQVYKINEL